jgi:hypothetical protein
MSGCLIEKGGYYVKMDIAVKSGLKNLKEGGEYR